MIIKNKSTKSQLIIHYDAAITSAAICDDLRQREALKRLQRIFNAVQTTTIYTYLGWRRYVR